MTVCDQCKQLFDGIADICPDCAWENERIDAAYFQDNDDDELNPPTQRGDADE